MESLFERLCDLAGSGRRFAVATVVRTEGSTPQTIGARLIVTEDPDQRPAGTLGGGCVEADAMLALRDVLAGAAPAVREYQLNEDLAWNTGLVCGGTMWILAERGDAAICCGGRPLVDELRSALTGGSAVALVTLLERQGRQVTPAARIAVLDDGRVMGSLGRPELDERAARAAIDQIARGPAARVSVGDAADLLIEPVLSRPELIVAGGGHVAKAIARQAQLLDFAVTVLEDRPEFADPARFDGARVVAGPIAESLASLVMRPQTFVVIATRGHKLDADCVLAAVSTRARYIGLLGSRRKTRLVQALLREHGVPDARIAVVRAPVGLDLGGRTPAEIALAILAEITQVRYGGRGTPLASE
jgi:xanthine dehydrogenase accessory factor